MKALGKTLKFIIKGEPISKAVDPAMVKAKSQETLDKTAKVTRDFGAWMEEMKTSLKSARHKLGNLSQTNFDLGLYHLHHRHVQDAIMRFKMVEWIAKESGDTQYNLGRCACLKGQLDKAQEYLGRSLELDNAHPGAGFLLHAIAHTEGNQDVPRFMIEEHYDYYAKSFDPSSEEAQQEKKLHGSLFRKLLTFIDDKNPNLKILDLGCGVGNVALYFKNKDMVRRVAGVDVSKEMVVLCKKKKVEEQELYDSLDHTLVAEFVKNHKQTYDLIVAIDVTPSIADLSAFLESLKGLLEKNGHLVFSSYSASGGKAVFDTSLLAYTHPVGEVKKAIQKAGYKILATQQFLEDDFAIRRDAFIITR